MLGLYLNDLLFFFVIVRFVSCQNYDAVPFSVAVEPATWTVPFNGNAVFTCQILTEPQSEPSDNVPAFDEAADNRPVTTERQILWFQHKESAELSLDDINADLQLYKNTETRANVDETKLRHYEHLAGKLTLNSLHFEDGGWYTCIGSSSEGMAWKSVYLTVREPPTHASTTTTTTTSTTEPIKDIEVLTTQSTTIVPVSEPVFVRPSFSGDTKLKINNNGSYQLDCSVKDAMADVIINWTVDGAHIMRPIVYSNEKQVLLLESLTADDQGIYECKVCNANDPLLCAERSFNISLPLKPTYEPILNNTLLLNATALQYGTAVFKCEYRNQPDQSRPYYFFTHYKKSEPNRTVLQIEQLLLNYNPFNLNDTEFEYLYPNVSGTLDTTYTVFGVHLSNVSRARDEGWYLCVIVHQNRTEAYSAYLTVLEPELVHAQPLWLICVAMAILMLLVWSLIWVVCVYRRDIYSLEQEIEIPVLKFVSLANVNEEPKQCTAIIEENATEETNWEIPREKLVLGTLISEGVFGRVFKAEVSGLMDDSTQTAVAVKTVKEEYSASFVASLGYELEVMKLLGKHKNIVNLLGTCTQDGPMWAIVEYAPHGTLQDFLLRNRTPPTDSTTSKSIEKRVKLNEEKLLTFAYQIANGMKYLATKKCIHRDLAARNVHVCDDFVMKIADFGLARDFQAYEFYRRCTAERPAFKWQSPESLLKKYFDSQSNVWSYGVLLWELMTLGDPPYPTVGNVKTLYSYLISGRRMDKPERCSLDVYMVMRQCWRFNAIARPTFSDLVTNINKLLSTLNTCPRCCLYLDLATPIVDTPPSSADECCLVDSDTEVSEVGWIRVLQRHST